MRKPSLGNHRRLLQGNSHHTCYWPFAPWIEYEIFFGKHQCSSRILHNTSYNEKYDQRQWRWMEGSTKSLSPTISVWSTSFSACLSSEINVWKNHWINCHTQKMPDRILTTLKPWILTCFQTCCRPKDSCCTASNNMQLWKNNFCSRENKNRFEDNNDTRNVKCNNIDLNLETI